ncbi:YceI family protein [Microscilla marina]|uniref:YceI like family protein n=1 Tax=Microscilla marina ATCC 23134 TaxID=313606 RepID=A1ZUG7_MICM2|nr:YceI family protein [Microscilla marina]EAY25986.1 YceI like family protein [Microscilla marina ATCC 23134]
MANTGNWAIDPMHSEIQFKVKHLVISTVTGSFQKFDGKIVVNNEDFSDSQVSFSADIDSIVTNNKQRDEHLKSDDFFSAEKFPKLTFESTSFTKIDDENYRLTGNLTIRDVTKEVHLDVEYGGVAEDFYGNVKSGFTLLGKLSRKEFGLQWNGITEAGKVVVGDTIKLIASVQFAKVKQEVEA